MQEDMNDVQLMIAIKIYTKKLYQNVIMYVIFVSKILLTHKFFCSIYLNLHNNYFLPATKKWLRPEYD